MVTLPAFANLIGVITNESPTESELVPRFVIRIGGNGRFEKTGQKDEAIDFLPVLLR